MQLLGSISSEEGLTKGLGVVPNKIEKFSNRETKKKKIPHVGFNSVKFEKKNKLFLGLENNSDFYFVHSYRMMPENLKNNISITDYGVSFLSSFNLTIYLQLNFILKKVKVMVYRFKKFY